MPLRATYRLQLTADFGFAAAAALVPYLADLGVSHLYLSPILAARSGSTHGYDVVDPTRVSAELGGEVGFRRLAATAAEGGLGIVVDVVPNHMAASDENPWWVDGRERARVFDIDPESGHYRRFFDIDDLAAVRQEDPAVFGRTHATLLALYDEGLIDGLRIDHPDGLADPAEYLRRLADAGVARVWVEKILHPGEALRDWPVAGTTGYEFLVDVAALFVDPDGEVPLTELYAALTGEHRPFAQVAREAQLEQAHGPFRPEVDRLARLAPDLERDAIEAALADLPVYRTFVEPWSGRVDEADRAVVAEAGMDARLARRLVLDEPGHEELVVRFQQTSPPVTAKGIEDTAYYRYLRLAALCEVGGDPGRFGLPVEAFHAAMARRSARFPESLLATSTHDTKRSADTRAIMGALAGVAGEWAERVRRWFALTDDLVDGGGPDAHERYLIFQTLVGVWPIDPGRLTAYLEKALREAKRTTDWVDPDTDHEAAVARFATALLGHQPFLDDFEPFQARVADAGRRAALAQVLIKLTAPGVPDIYQGDESWDRSLVDPDNRRPVDFEARRRALAGFQDGAGPTADTVKQWVIWRTLALRARRPGPFSGPYRPLDAGPGTCAYLRGDAEVLVVAPLRPAAGAASGRVDVPAGRWRAVLDRGLEIAMEEPADPSDLVGSVGLGLWERVGSISAIR